MEAIVTINGEKIQVSVSVYHERAEPDASVSLTAKGHTLIFGVPTTGFLRDGYMFTADDLINFLSKSNIHY